MMIIQGIRNDKPVALPVDETGRLLVSTNAVGNQVVSGTVAISGITNPITLQDGPPDTQAISVVVGSPSIYTMTTRRPITIKAVPGVIPPDTYGTMLVEYRVDPTDEFTAWPAGTVSMNTVMKLNGPIEALRFTAAVADGTVRIAQ